MEPKEIFLEIVKSDEYLATFADGPTFAKKVRKQKYDDFSFKMGPQSITGFGNWQNAGVTTEVSTLVRIRTQVKTVKG